MNAVILAAGVGHRMINLTRQLNKTLLPVGGVTIMERCIMYLKQAGIEDITIITGHKHEMFLPFEKKYQVRLIHNKKYSVYNNLYSLKLAMDHLEDTFVIHGDVVLFKNLFLRKPQNTTFYTIFKNPKGVPTIEVLTDQYRSMTGYTWSRVNDKITTHLGITYFDHEHSEMIKDYFQYHVNEKKLKEYKGEIDIELFELFKDQKLDVCHVDNRYAMDINLIEDYYQACIKYETYWKEK